MGISDDIILKSHFDDFKQQFDYDNQPDDKAFELFVIYSVVSKYIKTDTLSSDLLEQFNIGDGGDWGIDGLIIIINGKIVTTTQEVYDLLSANSFIEAKIITVQAKTSSNFKVSELGNFLDGNENLLRGISGITNLPPENEKLSDYRRILECIYSKSAEFKDGKNPAIYAFFASCGDYNEQQDFVSKIEKTKQFITSLELTRDFQCHILDKKTIVKYYKETKSKSEATIKVEQKIPLPEMHNITESYLCLIPFREFKKLIIDDNNNIIDSVFYDNIRAFQGDNMVNKAMSDFLRTGNYNGDISLFTAMNNGITIIAKNLKTTGVKMFISDYQIVNGCQTSNVLQQNANVPGIDDLMLTVKIISSDDKDIRDKIIVGNNSQTEVKREQLVALLETQKQIEDYYNAQNVFEKLYYERRSKQYKFETKVPQCKVITIPFQIKAFVAMILEKPDEVRGYYGSIVESFDKNGLRVFDPKTKPELYYTSALACYKMEKMFRFGILPNQYKKIKFHLLLAFKLMAQKEQTPPTNSHKVKEYCDYICNILSNNDQCTKYFNDAINLINAALDRKLNDNDRMNKDFTREIIKLSNMYKTLMATVK